MLNFKLSSFVVYFFIIHYFFNSVLLNLINLFLFFNFLLITNLIPTYITAFIVLILGILSNCFKVKEALFYFSSQFIWQIMIILLISKALIKSEIVNKFSAFLLGNKKINLHELVHLLNILNLLISFFIPSNFAKTSAIFIPLINSFNLEEKNKNFLLLNCLFTNSALTPVFLTHITNLVIKNIAFLNNVKITYLNCLSSTIIPSLICLFTIPYILSLFLNINTKETINLKNNNEPLTNKQKFTLLLIIFFIFGSMIFDIFYVSLFNLLMLLISNIFDYKKDILKNEEIWGLLLWLAVFSLLIDNLFKNFIYPILINNLKNYSFFSILTIYGYSHYFFASTTIHAQTLYSAFLNCLNLNNNFHFKNAIILLQLSSSFSGLTTYSSTESILINNESTLKKTLILKIGFFLSTYISVIFLIFNYLY